MPQDRSHPSLSHQTSSDPTMAVNCSFYWLATRDYHIYPLAGSTMDRDGLSGLSPLLPHFLRRDVHRPATASPNGQSRHTLLTLHQSLPALLVVRPQQAKELIFCAQPGTAEGRSIFKRNARTSEVYLCVCVCFLQDAHNCPYITVLFNMTVFGCLGSTPSLSA